MRVSQLFTKTQKQAPADEVAKNAQLLIRAGYIYKDSAGVYAMLPLGLSVLNKVMEIVREEMNAIDGQELAMTALQRRELWAQTDRWDDKQVDVWFKTKLKNGTEVGLGWSHEEQLTEMMKQYISSYRDLPQYAYQFQTKFRNETRAKSGIMRTREFIMKDLYSFSRSDKEHDEFYEKAKIAYQKIFERLGIGDQTYLTVASGGAFAEFSHEFQTICEAGEDTIYLDRGKKIAINEEVYTSKTIANLGLDKAKLEKVKTAEVGNIFSLGTSKSEPLGLMFTDEDGNEKPVVMGSYGIGPARVMGVVTELLSDEGGIVWPESIAPFKVHLISLGQDEKAEELYERLREKGIEVLYDDRDVRAGEKFADADLIGIPHRVVVSKKSLDAGGVEYKKRAEKDSKILSEAELLKLL